MWSEPHWADGFGTAYFALLSPASLIAFAIAIQQTKVLAPWTEVVLIIAAVTLLGQYAAFRGALPFPPFLAFIVIGIGLLFYHDAIIAVGQHTNGPCCF